MARRIIAPPVMMVVTMLYALQKSVACVRAILGDFEDVSQTSKTAEMLESCQTEDDSADQEEQFELKSAS